MMKRVLTVILLVLTASLCVSCRAKKPEPKGPTAVVHLDSGEQIRVVNWIFEYSHDWFWRSETDDGIIVESTTSRTITTNDHVLRLRLGYDDRLEIEPEDLAEIAFDLDNDGTNIEMKGVRITTRDGEVHEIKGRMIYDYPYYFPDHSPQQIRDPSITLCSTDKALQDELSNRIWLKLNKYYQGEGSAITRVEFLPE